jgi:hypothetical protein
MYTLTIGTNRRRFSGAVPLLVALDREGLISPAAYGMPIDDVVWQVNQVNGGEVTVS